MRYSACKQSKELANDLLWKLDHEYQFRLERMVSECTKMARELHAIADALQDRLGFQVLSWDNSGWSAWKPSKTAPDIVRFGQQTVAKPILTELRSRFTNLDLDFRIPVVVEFSAGQPVLVQVDGASRTRAVGVTQSILGRLLATAPPGKLRFTFIDPIGLGQSVATFMPLGDYDEKLVTSRAWSEPEHIDKRLKELTEHVENVIQKYLRHKFETIEDYNRQANEVAEPYRVLVVLDFPVNFTEAAARRLVSLVQHGPRCGVYPIIVQDLSKPLPNGFTPEDLYQAAATISYTKGHCHLAEAAESSQCVKEASKTSGLTDVVLVACGGRKVALIKSLCALTDLSFVEAEKLVEGAPQEARDLVTRAPRQIKQRIERKEAEKIKGLLEEVGATVRITESGVEVRHALKEDIDVNKVYSVKVVSTESLNRKIPDLLPGMLVNIDVEVSPNQCYKVSNDAARVGAAKTIVHALVHLGGSESSLAGCYVQAFARGEWINARATFVGGARVCFDADDLIQHRGSCRD